MTGNCFSYNNNNTASTTTPRRKENIHRSEFVGSAGCGGAGAPRGAGASARCPRGRGTCCRRCQRCKSCPRPPWPPCSSGRRPRPRWARARQRPGAAAATRRPDGGGSQRPISVRSAAVKWGRQRPSPRDCRVKGAAGHGGRGCDCGAAPAFGPE